MFSDFPRGWGGGGLGGMAATVTAMMATVCISTDIRPATELM